MEVCLVMIKSDGETRLFSLPSTVTIIGRRRDCDLCIPLMVISRRHCEFDQDEGKLHLRDLKSRNGVFLNSKQVQSCEVKAGDIVSIGPINFAVQIDGKPSLEEIVANQTLREPLDSAKQLSEEQELDATTEGFSEPDFTSFKQ